MRGNRCDIEQDFGYGLCGLQAHPKSDSQNWYKSRALVLIRTPPLQVFLVSFLKGASKLVLICSLSLIIFFHRNKEQEFRHIFLSMLSKFFPILRCNKYVGRKHEQEKFSQIPVLDTATKELTMHIVLRKGLTSNADPTLSKVKEMVVRGAYDQTLVFYKQHLHPSTPSALHAIIPIFPSLIKATSLAPSLDFGLQLHCLVLKMGSHSHSIISNSLLSMYAKFSQVEAALLVFNTMTHRDTITWSSLVNCYAQNGYFKEASEMLKEMYTAGFLPKPQLIASIISICGRSGELRLGRQIHALVTADLRIKEELELESEQGSVFLSTALLDMYLRCGDCLMAFRVFDRIKLKNHVSWTAMVSGCCANGNYDVALHCFRAMLVEGIRPNRVTLLALLPACANLGGAKHAKQLHGYAFRHGFESDFHFSAALVHFYGEFGEALRSAKLIFERMTHKDVVMWSTIIKSYSAGGNYSEAIRLFREMQLEGIAPNSVTLLPIISACTNLSSHNHGRGVHGFAFKSGLSSQVVIGNSLINMYSKCGCLMASHQIFQEMLRRDSVSWSTLISAHGLHGQGEKALQLFREMQERGADVDAITFLAVLSACNHTGLVKEGQELFNDAMKDNKISLTMEHYACYIDLLGRSGKLQDACDMINTMPMKPSTRIWSSFVSACKVHGRLQFAEMLAHQLVKLEPGNAANYTLLSMVYAESSNWMGVEEVRKVMRDRGLRKNYGFSQIELENKS